MSRPRLRGDVASTRCRGVAARGPPRCTAADARRRRSRGARAPPRHRRACHVDVHAAVRLDGAERAHDHRKRRAEQRGRGCEPRVEPRAVVLHDHLAVDARRRRRGCAARRACAAVGRTRVRLDRPESERQPAKDTRAFPARVERAVHPRADPSPTWARRRRAGRRSAAQARRATRSRGRRPAAADARSVDAELLLADRHDAARLVGRRRHERAAASSPARSGDRVARQPAARASDRAHRRACRGPPTRCRGVGETHRAAARLLRCGGRAAWRAPRRRTPRRAARAASRTNAARIATFSGRA